MGKKYIPFIAVSKETVKKEELSDAWRSAIDPLFDTQVLNDVTDYSESVLEIFGLGSASFMYHNMHEHIFTRNRKKISYYDNDYLSLCLWLEGSINFNNNSRSGSARSSSSFLVDMTKEAQGVATASQCITFNMSRSLVKDLGFSIHKLGGLQLLSNDPKSQIMRNAYVSAYRSLKYIDAFQTDAVTQGLASLALNFFSSIECHTDYGIPIVRAATLATVIEYIEENIHDPQLNVKTIADKFSISRATVYRLLKPVGGVSTFIKERKLYAIFKDIKHSKCNKKRLYEIAQSYGFSNASFFSRSFKEQFGFCASDALGSNHKDIYKTPGDYSNKQVDKIRCWLIAGKQEEA